MGSRAIRSIIRPVRGKRVLTLVSFDLRWQRRRR